MENKVYTEIMLDLETMGINPDAAIVSIGAIKFNLEDRDYLNTIDESRTFYSLISLESAVSIGGVITPSVVLWWLKQSESARNEITKKGNFLHESLGAFSAFLEYSRPDRKQKYNVWGKPDTFDCVILRETYKRFHGDDRDSPWSFRQDMNLNTLKMLATRINPAVNHRHDETTLIAHNSKDDAMYQVLLAQRYWRVIKGSPSLPGDLVG